MTIDRLAGLPDDTSVTPNPARMYDYILGGNHNTEADRIAAEQARAIYPDMPLVFRSNRAFLRRAVLYLHAQGIDQFLDIGSGIPTIGNVHETAQAANEDAHVVYVDVDPVAVTLSAAALRGNARATVIQADARDPASILNHPETRRLLDFSRPVALLLVSMLLFVPDDTEATGLVRTFRDALAPGSYLALSHPVSEATTPEVAARGEDVYARTDRSARARPRAQVEDYFAGFEVVDPGVVWLPLWRPEDIDDFDGLLDKPQRSAMVGGVGRKP